MPRDLKRYQHSGQSHFLTFSCHQRRAYFSTSALRDLFLECLERTRRKYRFLVYGYVVMPEHVHLLLSEPEIETLAKAIQALKVSFVRRSVCTPHQADGADGRDGAPHLPSSGRCGRTTSGRGNGTSWQRRYHDHNVRNHESFSRKLDYIHNNPVKRGLCSTPMDWRWSSFRHYATAVIGAVEIESEWTAIRRTGREPKLLRN